MFKQYFLAILSVLLFIHGFFPIPPPRKHHVDIPERFAYKPKSKFQKAVIVIIDALRLDFVPSQHMEFLTRKYQENGCYSQLKVETPTVTMPRIKALTTGAVPQFIDIVMNLASPTVVEDSLIHRAKSANKSIVFYGDDVWLKMFPNLFTRSEGTTSFFVNDFWQVDQNVTRNVEQELNKTDWDIMILHYLGLDHIGHVYGPKSSLMPTKLEEMDAVVRNIYEKLAEQDENFLVIVTGDHGMRDSGGHGGSTFSETNIPFVVLGMPCHNSSFSQIDATTNLAILLGFEIPSTGMGNLQYSLLSNMTLDEYLSALSYNTFLLKSKLNFCEEDLETAMYFHDLFLLDKNVEIGLKAVKYYRDCSLEISSRLLKSSVTQNVTSLLIATISSLCILVRFVLNHLKIDHDSNTEFFIQFATIALQFFVSGNVSYVLVIVAVIMLLRKVIRFKNIPLKILRESSIILVLLIMHPFIFFASSFVEEEHQFWYFFFSSFILLQLISHKKYELLSILLCVRFLRTINQVGDKWSSWPDLADWFNQEENIIYLNILCAIALVLIFFCCFLLNNNKSHLVIDGTVLIMICTYRIVGENVHIARFIWFLIAIKIVYSAYIEKVGFVSIWILIISLLMKRHNHVLVPFCVFSNIILKKTFQDSTLLSLLHWWLGNMLYFMQGHDNSFSSVDISVGYIGLKTYEPFLVFPQVLFHTYAFPVLSHLLMLRNRKRWRHYFSIFFTFRLYTVVFVFVVMFIQRHHLFVWSVFAPKIFVEASHITFLFIEISIFYVCNQLFM